MKDIRYGWNYWKTSWVKYFWKFYLFIETDEKICVYVLHMCDIISICVDQEINVKTWSEAETSCQNLATAVMYDMLHALTSIKGEKQVKNSTLKKEWLLVLVTHHWDWYYKKIYLQ